jgi:Flp pilus assembly protein TadG
MITRPRRSNRQAGNALIEFGLSISLLWALVAGVYQFGYSFYAYNLLMTSVANAAQMGAQLSYDTGSPSTITNQIKNMAVYGDINGGTTPLVSGITTDNVGVDFNLDSLGMPHNVTVYMTGYTLDAFFAKYTMPDKPRVTAQYTGRVVCASC